MFLSIQADSDFSIYNLPFGIFSTRDRSPRIGVAIGDAILDLYALADLGLFPEIDPQVFQQKTLNDLIALGKKTTTALRLDLQRWLQEDFSLLRENPAAFVPQAEATMHMPIEIGDYTDFYSSIEHATNVGKMFRDPANALLPNWRHIPVGYHGRASSVVVSGTPVQRPCGQVKGKDEVLPQFQASARLDFELETGFIIGKATAMGQRIGTAEAGEYIFGKVLLNDWSARDIQAWEYVPLGPFLAKNFATSISPWVVTMEALEPFRVAGPVQEPVVLPYLAYEGLQNYDLNLFVELQTSQDSSSEICRSNFKYMYWNMAQQLAHHTVNGCNVRIGDLMGSGTISGPTPDSYGSMLELAWSGTQPIRLEDGSTRSFLEDGDTVTMRGYGLKDGVRVGFGAVHGQILPAIC